MKEFKQEIILMIQESEELRERYGSESKIVQKLERRIKLFVKFYDEMQELNHLVTLFKVNYGSSQMLRAKKKGLSYEDQAKLNGFDPEKWKKIDSIDETINYAKKVMNGIDARNEAQ